jgi:hypothetical protein
VPSGFLILADGRCLAVRWHYYDLTLRTVAESLEESSPARALREWLLTLAPSLSDVEELGYGAWFRPKDRQVIRKYLDLRELTPENQRLFHEAALRAGKLATSPAAAKWDKMLVDCLVHLSDMVERADRGEAPLSLSDWVSVKPSEGKKIGPGWEGA